MKQNRKRYYPIIGIIFVILFLCPMSVDAAYAYKWTVDGEMLSGGSSNKAGTATWEADESYSGGVLELKNYQGGQLKIDCYGTGLDHVFAIKLVGENTITVPKGTGIIANAPIVFIGDGKLTINASVPIGSGGTTDPTNQAWKDIEDITWNNDTTMVIDQSKNALENSTSQKENEDDQAKNEENDNENSETTVDEEKTSFLNSPLVSIIIISYCVISLVVIIILFIQLNSNKKNLSIKKDDE